MGDGEKSSEELLKDYTQGVISGAVAKENQDRKKPKTTHPTSFSRPPVFTRKNAGQPNSKSGFPKGSVGTGGSWTPD